MAGTREYELFGQLPHGCYARFLLWAPSRDDSLVIKDTIEKILRTNWTTIATKVVITAMNKAIVLDYDIARRLVREAAKILLGLIEGVEVYEKDVKGLSEMCDPNRGKCRATIDIDIEFNSFFRIVFRGKNYEEAIIRLFTMDEDYISDEDRAKLQQLTEMLYDDVLLTKAITSGNYNQLIQGLTDWPSQITQ